MNLELMRFKDYVWKNNPRQLKITHKRNIKETSVPYSSGIVRDYGGKAKIIKGAGEFFGEKCIEEFEKLKLVHNQGGIGYLILPKMKPFLALFRSLECEENPTPNLIRYNFEFVEHLEDYRCNISCVKRYHIVKAGETLWDISYKHNKSVESLLFLNPSIKKPNDLSEGEKVKIV